MSSSSEEEHQRRKRKRRGKNHDEEELLKKVKELLENKARRRARFSKFRRRASRGRSRSITRSRCSSHSSSSAKENRLRYGRGQRLRSRRSRSRSYISGGSHSGSTYDERYPRGTSKRNLDRADGERSLRGPSRHTDSRENVERNPRGPSRYEDPRETELPIETIPTQNTALLELLGEDAEPEKLGLPINNRLAEKWTSIMKDGLPTTTKLELLKKYPPAKNCAMIKAPQLNPEVKPAMNGAAIKKDQHQSTAQNQLGTGIGAIGKALSTLLDRDGVSVDDQAQLVELLSDAGRILADLHHTQSIARRSFIVPGLSLIVKNIADETPVDTYLFGEEFANKLKAAKEIEKSSKDIMRAQPVTTNNKVKAATHKQSYGGPPKQNNHQRDLNWKRPPKKGQSNQSQGGQKPRYATSNAKQRSRR